MADTPILNYKGKYDGPEIDKAVELALGLENPKSCPYYVHISLSKPDYVLTIGLGDAEGNLFNHAEIDLPLESMVVNATYENGNIILHLQDGTSTEPIPISALIAGLVSENRTIAGIDLKDDITQKELRDALDVYTKDSVDQLVTDLEDRIDETLNEMKQSLDDLSEQTSEHDTQIKKAEKAIEVNQRSIGIQASKNLFDISSFKKIVSYAANGTILYTNNGFTLSATAKDCYTAKYGPDGLHIPVFPNRTYTLSWTADSDTAGTMMIFPNGIQASPNIYAYNNETKKLTFTTKSNTEYVTVRFGVQSAGTSITYSNIQIEEGSVATTYEPYVPSVNEHLGWVEESVSELTPQVEQNKSDILSVKNDIAINRATLGAQCKNELIMVQKSLSNYKGIDVVINDDKSIAITGTPTESIYLGIGNFYPKKAGKYVLSGCPTGGGFNSHVLYFPKIQKYDVGNSITIDVTTTEVLTVNILVKNGIEHNLTFYPMVRSADITDSTYEPYTPSVNERLTVNENNISKAESEIEYNKIKWGRVLASGLPSGVVGWYKIASCELAVPSESTTRNATFLISHHSGTWGILKTHIIINPSNVSKFVMNSIMQGINTKNIIGIAKRENNVQKCEIWCKCTYAGEYYRFVILDNGSSGIPNNYNEFWQLHSTTAYQTNEPSDYDDKAETTDVIKDLSDRITALENK